jgi:predicted DNA-binding transcriptional regulator YafY
MKIDRLLGIITILSQKEKVTAPELARRFEVSRRTINRDIEDICKAGIPIVTKQGSNGGISIQEGYKLDTSLLKSDDLINIITGLKGINSVSRASNIEMLIEKLAPDNSAMISLANNIIIDLASYYKTSLSEKIDIIKNAIVDSKLIEFTYYSPKGEDVRVIEPYIITFKWTSWYVFGYCTPKEDFRMFKLNRLWELIVVDQHFEKRAIPDTRMDFDTHFTDHNKFKVVFDSSVKYQLVEEYGKDCYEVMEDGKLLYSGSYTNRDFIVKWLLGFGDKATVVEPCELAEEIIVQAQKILDNYNKHDI